MVFGPVPSTVESPDSSQNCFSYGSHARFVCTYSIRGLKQRLGDRSRLQSHEVDCGTIRPSDKRLAQQRTAAHTIRCHPSTRGRIWIPRIVKVFSRRRFAFCRLRSCATVESDSDLRNNISCISRVCLGDSVSGQFADSGIREVQIVSNGQHFSIHEGFLTPRKSSEI
jgi:hypothetical protein